MTLAQLELVKEKRSASIALYLSFSLPILGLYLFARFSVFAR